MLKEYRLENFKAIGSSQILPIRPITLIFGPNSSGKSSIIQSLLMLKQSLEEQEGENGVLLPRGSQVDLGSFREFIHGHNLKNDFKFRFDFDDSTEKAPADTEHDTAADLDDEPFLWRGTELLGRLPFNRVGIEVDLRWDTEAKQIILEEMAVFVGAEPLAKFKPFQISDETIVPIEDPNRNLTAAVELSWINPAHSFWVWIWERFGAERLQVVQSKVSDELARRRTEFDNAPDGPPGGTKREAGTFVLGYLTKADLAPRIRDLQLIADSLGDYGPTQLPLDYFEFAKTIHLLTKGFCPSSMVETSPGQDHSLAFPSVWRLTNETVSDSVLWKIFENELYELPSFPYVLEDIGKLWTSFVPGDLLSYLGELIEETLMRFVYIGPLRSPPERYYTLSGSASGFVGKTGKWTADILFRDQSLLKRVNDQFDKFKIDYQLKIAILRDESEDIGDIYGLRLVEKGTGVSISGTDVGFGISQVLPIIVQSILSKEKSICIEQPEIHLHPALQAELGDLFIDSALGERKNTFILETHSEHLILRILRRIRETAYGELEEGLRPIKPEDVQVIYAEPTVNGTILHDLPITLEGDFARKWPDGFFTERAKELFS